MESPRSPQINFVVSELADLTSQLKTSSKNQTLRETNLCDLLSAHATTLSTRSISSANSLLNSRIDRLESLLRVSNDTVKAAQAKGLENDRLTKRVRQLEGQVKLLSNKSASPSSSLSSPAFPPSPPPPAAQPSKFKVAVNLATSKQIKTNDINHSITQIAHTYSTSIQGLLALLVGTSGSDKANFGRRAAEVLPGVLEIIGSQGSATKDRKGGASAPPPAPLPLVVQIEQDRNLARIVWACVSNSTSCSSNSSSNNFSRPVLSRVSPTLTCSTLTSSVDPITRTLTHMSILSSQGGLGQGGLGQGGLGLGQGWEGAELATARLVESVGLRGKGQSCVSETFVNSGGVELILGRGGLSSGNSPVETASVRMLVRLCNGESPTYGAFLDEVAGCAEMLARLVLGAFDLESQPLPARERERERDNFRNFRHLGQVREVLSLLVEVTLSSEARSVAGRVRRGLGQVLTKRKKGVQAVLRDFVKSGRRSLAEGGGGYRGDRGGGRQGG